MQAALQRVEFRGQRGCRGLLRGGRRGGGQFGLEVARERTGRGVLEDQADREA
ncbi:hypothetical protein ATKI12_0002 [Kitasatospora sp. Ki12]